MLFRLIQAGAQFPNTEGFFQDLNDAGQTGTFGIDQVECAGEKNHGKGESRAAQILGHAQACVYFRTRFDEIIDHEHINLLFVNHLIQVYRRGGVKSFPATLFRNTADNGSDRPLVIDDKKSHGENFRRCR